MNRSRGGRVDVDELLTTSKEPRRYELVIVQHSEIARATSPSERDRRVVDPPCILQLKIYDKRGMLDDDAMRSPYWVVHCMLQGDHEKPSQLLQGQLTSSASYVTAGWAHQAGCYFIFNDLTLSTPGIYHLKFLLTTVRALPIRPNELPVLKVIYSRGIRTYAQKEFPGMSASSDLVKSLAEQSLGLSVRHSDHRNRFYRAQNP